MHSHEGQAAAFATVSHPRGLPAAVSFPGHFHSRPSSAAAWHAPPSVPGVAAASLLTPLVHLLLLRAERLAYKLTPPKESLRNSHALSEMGKRGGQKRESNIGATSSSVLHTSLSLREEASGRKQSPNPKSLLKLKHLQNLAEWATKEASIPPLGAFFGCRFTEFGEALGIRPDPSLFPCQRCETLLLPGINCIVRIEKNPAKSRHRCGKTDPPTQNNVVYTCSSCSRGSLKRGTPKGHMKGIRPSKSNLPSKLKSGNPTAERSDGAEKSNTEKVKSQEVIETSSPTTGNMTSSFTESQATPAAKLLDSNKSKRKKAGPKGSTDQSLAGLAPADTKDASGTNTSRKRRKSWTTLKEIAKNDELERNHRFQKTSNSISPVARDQWH